MEQHPWRLQLSSVRLNIYDSSLSAMRRGLNSGWVIAAMGRMGFIEVTPYKLESCMATDLLAH